ncbi:MAG: hypothetical protein AAF633_20810 [Chloroflexota bacterium]
MEEFDVSRATLGGRPTFKPFVANGATVPLSRANLPQEGEIIVVERGGEKLAFSVRQISYHHLAQGTLAGEPYMVSF